MRHCVWITVVAGLALVDLAPLRRYIRKWKVPVWGNHFFFFQVYIYYSIDHGFCVRKKCYHDYPIQAPYTAYPRPVGELCTAFFVRTNVPVQYITQRTLRIGCTTRRRSRQTELESLDRASASSRELLQCRKRVFHVRPLAYMSRRS